jgi:CheY-like chemotaxis protein
MSRPNGSPTILLVEDDAENREAMSKVMQATGCRVLETDNPIAALDLVLREDVKVLITDMQLPGMDGVELLRRAKRAVPKIAVLCITGFDRSELAEEALKDGACGVLSKPVRRAQLLESIRRALERSDSA